MPLCEHYLDTLAIYHEIDLNIANAINYAVERINAEFGDIVQNGYLTDILIRSKSMPGYANYDPKRKVVYLNENISQNNALQELAEDAAYQYQRGGWSTDSPYHSVYHELGHAVQHMLCDGNSVLRDKITALLKATRNEILGEKADPKTKDKKLKSLYGKKSKNAGTSLYALFDEGEFISESIAQYLNNVKPGSIAEKVIALLKGK